MNLKEINIPREEALKILKKCKNKKSFCQQMGFKDYRSFYNICSRLSIDPDLLGADIENYKKEIKKGDIFNHLTVIKPSYKQDKRGEKISYCQCSCGNFCDVKNDYLKRSHTKSCGHLSGCQEQNKIKDGDIFGLLKVIKANAYKDDHNELRSLCLCACGESLFIKNNCLRRGQYSCGCVHSRGELKIKKILQENNIKFQSQYSFCDLKGEQKVLRFDFAIFDKDDKILSLIEYQGEQHYQDIKEWGGKEKFEKVKKYDEIKRQYCKEHNYNLFEIPYADFDRIDFEYLKQGFYYE